MSADRESASRESASRDHDTLQSLAYLAGELTGDAARAFELRLGREPEFARRFEELARTHDLLAGTLGSGDSPRAELAPSSRSRGLLPRRRAARWRWAAAALVLVALALAQRTLRTPGPLEFAMAAVPTAPSDAGFNELLGLDPDWLPAGMGYRGAGGQPPAADEYAAALQGAFVGEVERSLAGRAPVTPGTSAPGVVRARSFVVALRPEHACHALVVTVGNDGRIERVAPRAGSDATPLRAGGVHLLPRRPVELPPDWEDAMRVDYAPGVLVRDGLRAVVGVRAAAMEPPFLVELDAMLATVGERLARGELVPAAACDEIELWLTERSFVLETLRVDSP